MADIAEVLDIEGLANFENPRTISWP